MDSGSWWWTGRPGVLGSTGSQRDGHDWVTELCWTDWCYCNDEGGGRIRGGMWRGGALFMIRDEKEAREGALGRSWGDHERQRGSWCKSSWECAAVPGDSEEPIVAKSPGLRAEVGGGVKRSLYNTFKKLCTSTFSQEEEHTRCPHSPCTTGSFLPSEQMATLWWGVLLQGLCLQWLLLPPFMCY